MLNGKQKRYLRSLAVNENAIFQIGKDGLSDHLYTSVKEAFSILSPIFLTRRSLSSNACVTNIFSDIIFSSLSKKLLNSSYKIILRKEVGFVIELVV